MSKNIARYTYRVTKRRKDVEYGEDTTYTVTVKAVSIEDAKRKAEKLGETNFHTAWYTWRLDLKAVEEL
jgi:hypothetical protein